uniref:Candidate secreted effector n=1 Tax=Meloidogyne incognita TaxID=6306 RepID=A0A914M0J7_MELIC
MLSVNRTICKSTFSSIRSRLMNLLAFLDTCGSWQIWMLIISFLALHSLLVVFVIDSFITCLCIRLRKIKEEKEKKLLLLHPPPTEEPKQPPPPKPKPMKPTKEKKPAKTKEEKKLSKDKEKPAKEVEIKPIVNLASGLYENFEAAKEKTPPKEERPKETTARSSRDIAPPPPPPPSPPPEEKKSKSDVKIKREIKILPIMVKKKEKKKKDKKKPKKKKPSERSSTSGESGSDTKTEKPAKETKGRTVIQAIPNTCTSKVRV